MKKKFLLFLFFTVFICSCCSINSADQYLTELAEFNYISGFRSRFVNDDEIVKKAESEQGVGDYTGIDDWFAVDLDSGSEVLCGLPNQKEFYTIQETYNISKGNKKTFWELLQVKPPGYDSIGYFSVKKSVHVAISKVLSNDQFGKGGCWQLFVNDYSTVLKKDSAIAFNK